jgi:hypothetical protein
MHLRSTTLLSLRSRSIDLPSPGLRIPIISHPMTELPVLPPICSSFSPRGALRFPESITTSVSHPSLTTRQLLLHLPRLGRSISPASPPMPTSDIEDTCRDRHKSAKTSTLSGGLIPADMAPRTSLELLTLQTRMCLITSRPSFGTRVRITRDRSVLVSCPVAIFYKFIRQFMAEAKPKTVRTLSSPSIDSIRLDTTFSTLYYYTLVPTLTTLATAPRARNVTLHYHRKRNHHGSRVYPTSDHKPSPPPPSRAPFQLGGRLECQLTLIPSGDEGRGWAVD